MKVPLVTAVALLAPVVSEASCDCGAPMKVVPLLQRNPVHPNNGNALCWLTAGAMIKSWESHSTVSLAGTAGTAFKALYDAGRGLGPEREDEYYRHLGMTPAHQSISVQGLCDWVRNGPVFVSQWGGEETAGNTFSGGAHAVVITAMTGSCESSGSGTTIHYNDPWDGKSHTKSYSDFHRWTEGRAIDINENLDLQTGTAREATARAKSRGAAGMAYFNAPNEHRRKENEAFAKGKAFVQETAKGIHKKLKSGYHKLKSYLRGDNDDDSGSKSSSKVDSSPTKEVSTSKTGSKTSSSSSENGESSGTSSSDTKSFSLFGKMKSLFGGK